MDWKLRTLLCASVAVAPLTMGAQALAQATTSQSADAGVETVTVTAERRSENLQNVPLTVTAISSQALTASNVKSLQDLTTLVSGYVGPGDSAMEPIHLRGVGSETAHPGIESVVATYVDGVYISLDTPALNKLNDVDQIEVLKGPQGTLFGRNTTGGLIQVNTRDPSSTPELDVEAGYANYNTTSAWLYINTPVTSGITTNLSVQGSSQEDGWGKNLTTGDAAYLTPLNVSVRNKWNIELDDKTQLQLMFDYEDLREIGLFDERQVTGARDAAGPFHYTETATGWNYEANGNQLSHTEAEGYTMRLSHDFGFATLTDTAAFRYTRLNRINFDGDQSPNPFLSVTWDTSDKETTNELQLTSNSDGPLKWTVGFFYFDDPVPTLQFDNLLGHVFTITDRITMESYAAYAQASYEIIPATTLTLGARYTIDDHSDTGIVGFTGPQPSSSFQTGAPSWRAALSHQFSDDAMIYASYNRGTKSGGYNPVFSGIAPPGVGLKFNDEELDAYEVGSKLVFLDERARANLSAFYYNYNNLQVSGFAVGPPYLYNGGTATIYGVDGDFEFKLTPQLTLDATVEEMHSGFDAVSPSLQVYLPLPAGGYNLVTATSIGKSLKGYSLPYAPNTTASLAAYYTLPTSIGSWDLSATYSYNSGYFGTPGHELGQSSFSLLGSSIQYNDPSGRYYVRLWGSNLTDKQVADIVNVSTTGTIIGLDAPRTFGLTLGARFQ